MHIFSSKRILQQWVVFCQAVFAIPVTSGFLLHLRFWCDPPDAKAGSWWTRQKGKFSGEGERKGEHTMFCSPTLKKWQKNTEQIKKIILFLGRQDFYIFSKGFYINVDIRDVVKMKKNDMLFIF